MTHVSCFRPFSIRTSTAPVYPTRVIGDIIHDTEGNAVDIEMDTCQNETNKNKASDEPELGVSAFPYFTTSNDIAIRYALLRID